MAIARSRLVSLAAQRSAAAQSVASTSATLLPGRLASEQSQSSSSMRRSNAVHHNIRHASTSTSRQAPLRHAASATSASAAASSAVAGQAPSTLDSKDPARHRNIGPAQFTQAYNTESTPRTFLPTPLPPEITQGRTAAYRRRNGLNMDADVTPAKKGPARRATASAEGSESGRPASRDMDMTPLDALFADEALYAPPQTVESFAILRACLNTGLTNRARKIFDRLREEAAQRSPIRAASSFQAQRNAALEDDSNAVYSDMIGIDLYNAMIGAYFQRALAETSPRESNVWTQRAWDLFSELEDHAKDEYEASVSAVANPSTYALMAAGIVKLGNAAKYPSDTYSLSHLLVLLRQSSVSVFDVLTSPPLSPALEAHKGDSPATELRASPQSILVSLISAASDVSDGAMLAEIEQARHRLNGVAASDAQQDDALEEGRAVRPPKNDAPGLRPVLAKSSEGDSEDAEVAFNLRKLQENLSVISASADGAGDPYERQRALEFGALAAARDRFQQQYEQLGKIGLQNASKMQHKRIQEWMWDWYSKLEAALAKDIARLRSSPEEGHTSRSMEMDMLPFLCSLSPGKLSLITIMEVMRMQGTGGISEGAKTARVIVSVGRFIESECYAEALRKLPKSFRGAKEISQKLSKSGVADVRVRLELKKLLDKYNKEEGVLPSAWTDHMRARVGSFVTQHLLNVATVQRSGTDRDGVAWEDEQPAFYSAYQYVQGRRIGLIKLNPLIEQRISVDATIDTLHPRHLPMLVPPKPWLRYDSGGYYSSKSFAMRVKDNVEQGSYMKAASDNSNLETIFAGLDVLGSTAWTINEDVFKVMADVWNSGEAIGDVPPLELQEPEPVRPDNYHSDVRARQAYISALKIHSLRRAAVYSERCSTNYKLEIARAFLKERFYFPHNMDFRGRAYPLPPHLNHIGDDLCRGLLKFANAKPLGEAGLRWLRIHLANVFGYDKVSFSDREQFAIDHEEEIRKSVSDPLGEGSWWQKADDPWQALATCFELHHALQHPEGPEKYESNLPVHQDGTCNGLQHYAALGGDLAGAQQVNLSSGDRPSDVYTGVADLVIASLDRDAAAGNELAINLQGKVTRKVVKQTVMTTVYGVTFIGAREQVSRKLSEYPEISSEQLWTHSSYLAKKIIGSIGDLFEGAQAIQLWLKECATMIAKSIPPARLEEYSYPDKTDKTKRSPATRMSVKNLVREQMTSVIWTTPLGLPVVQPYRKLARKQLATKMQSIVLQDPSVATQVSSTKQASAFPPNFIHSLDATHMFLTALECENAKLTFASVHDSYWTHACDIETMSDIIRETFIRLHESEVLNRLRDEFLERYRGHRVPIKAVKDSNRRKYKQQQSKDAAAQQAKTAQPSSAIGADLSSAVLSEAAGDVKPDVADMEGIDSDEASIELDGQPNSIKVEGEGDMDAHFVLLADILPPVPKKGAFDVNEIKKSLYFFS